jgi:tetratricopeptide (TPR) repeat protein
MKFKNTKPKKVYKKAKVKSKEKLPRNYRVIPEKININSDDLTFFIGVFSILSAILIVSFSLYTNIKVEKRLGDEKVKVINQITFWGNVVQMHPDYRDAYFSLALLNYQIGIYDKAKNNLEKALSLDPNFEKGRELQKILSENN